jgi:hypothetical protein
MLVGIGIIAYATNHEARKLIHQPGGLHFKAINPKLCSELIPFGSVFHHLVSGGY